MRFFTERERPIHHSKLQVLAAMPKRFCNNRETSELFHLGSIILYLRLHGTYSSATPCTVNVQVQTSVPRCTSALTPAWLRWNELRSLSMNPTNSVVPA